MVTTARAEEEIDNEADNAQQALKADLNMDSKATKMLSILLQSNLHYKTTKIDRFVMSAVISSCIRMLYSNEML